MEGVLDPDFVELGRSGRVHDRDGVLALPVGEDWSAALHGLAVPRVAGGVALVTYISDQGTATLEA